MVFIDGKKVNFMDIDEIMSVMRLLPVNFFFVKKMLRGWKNGKYN